MAGMNYASLHKPYPLGGFLFGVLMLILGVLSIFTGKTLGKGGPTIRAKDPANYWITIAVLFLGGALLVWGSLFAN
jgi:preprotein translocase subunit SecY